MTNIKETNPIQPSCPDKVLAISIIPLFLLLVLVAGYMNLFPLKVESHTLIIISFILVVFTFFVRHNATFTACYIDRSSAHMENRLKMELDANALTIMRETKSTLNVKDFMEAYCKEIRNDHFARVATSIFPMLGILGTFIAIAISMPDFTVKDTNALDREISVLLSGIGTAFYASIYGITLSLIWTYFEKRGNTKIDKKLYNLERRYRTRIWRQVDLIKYEHMQSKLKDQQVVQTLKEIFNIDFIHTMNDQYLKNFMTIVTHATEGFSQVTKNMQVASQELRETLESIYDRREGVGTIDAIKNDIETFNENAREIRESMKHFDGSVEHTFDKIDNEVSQIVEKLTTFARMIAEQSTQISKISDQHKEENEKQ
ncbi:MAG: MotA/TolQ/ExbB proton channel family protein [Sulfurovum sp.]|nr:MotA/TolQ/ExbB proton channel family protein [Sulfurovum sp.]MCB4745345.1 MotA/TolQ/ExbB proton channel family protein [Sulfurovum sp.]MCB4750738.1 MotA/TolQ/ExbB proton channel family protein [Sulfurovum sp.]MCB4753736.1 MotA/TolQ/ExbB proton channel family protein [Sulfurovum sp.]MCB4761534.1 MotA/TolQ/ExbB proton channel family protein [Sulfurovum sp.]